MAIATARPPLLPALLLLLLVAADLASASLWPYKHVHVLNDMVIYRVPMHLHCWSASDDRGRVDVADNTEFTWRFKPHVFYTTRWTCDVSTDDHRVARFDAYWEDADTGLREHKNNIYWSVKDDGIYLRYTQENNRDELTTKWKRQWS